MSPSSGPGEPATISHVTLALGGEGLRWGGRAGSDLRPAVRGAPFQHPLWPCVSGSVPDMAQVACHPGVLCCGLEEPSVFPAAWSRSCSVSAGCAGL